MNRPGNKAPKSSRPPVIIDLISDDESEAELSLPVARAPTPAVQPARTGAALPPQAAVARTNRPPTPGAHAAQASDSDGLSILDASIFAALRSMAAKNVDRAAANAYMDMINLVASSTPGTNTSSTASSTPNPPPPPPAASQSSSSASATPAKRPLERSPDGANEPALKKSASGSASIKFEPLAFGEANIPGELEELPSLSATATTPGVGAGASAVSIVSTGKSPAVTTLEINDDDEIIVVDTGRASISAMDMPHQREACAVFPYLKSGHSVDKFTKQSMFIPEAQAKARNIRFCPKCYCYVCDVLASECKSWDMHCNATYKESVWKQERAYASDKIYSIMNSETKKMFLNECRSFTYGQLMYGSHEASANRAVAFAISLTRNRSDKRVCSVYQYSYLAAAVLRSYIKEDIVSYNEVLGSVPRALAIELGKILLLPDCEQELFDTLVGELNSVRNLIARRCLQVIVEFARFLRGTRPPTLSTGGVLLTTSSSFGTISATESAIQAAFDAAVDKVFTREVVDKDFASPMYQKQGGSACVDLMSALLGWLCDRHSNLPKDLWNYLWMHLPSDRPESKLKLILQRMSTPEDLKRIFDSIKGLREAEFTSLFTIIRWIQPRQLFLLVGIVHAIAQSDPSSFVRVDRLRGLLDAILHHQMLPRSLEREGLWDASSTYPEPGFFSFRSDCTDDSEKVMSYYSRLQSLHYSEWPALYEETERIQMAAQVTLTKESEDTHELSRLRESKMLFAAMLYLTSPLEEFLMCGAVVPESPALQQSSVFIARLVAAAEDLIKIEINNAKASKAGFDAVDTVAAYVNLLYIMRSNIFRFVDIMQKKYPARRLRDLASDRATVQALMRGLHELACRLVSMFNSDASIISMMQILRALPREMIESLTYIPANLSYRNVLAPGATMESIYADVDFNTVSLVDDHEAEMVTLTANVEVPGAFGRSVMPYFSALLMRMATYLVSGVRLPRWMEQMTPIERGLLKARLFFAAFLSFFDTTKMTVLSAFGTETQLMVLIKTLSDTISPGTLFELETAAGDAVTRDKVPDSALYLAVTFASQFLLFCKACAHIYKDDKDVTVAIRDWRRLRLSCLAFDLFWAKNCTDASLIRDMVCEESGAQRKKTFTRNWDFWDQIKSSIIPKRGVLYPHLLRLYASEHDPNATRFDVLFQSVALSIEFSSELVVAEPSDLISLDDILFSSSSGIEAPATYVKGKCVSMKMEFICDRIRGAYMCPLASKMYETMLKVCSSSECIFAIPSNGAVKESLSDFSEAISIAAEASRAYVADLAMKISFPPLLRFSTHSFETAITMARLGSNSVNLSLSLPGKAPESLGDVANRLMESKKDPSDASVAHVLESFRVTLKRVLDSKDKLIEAFLILKNSSPAYAEPVQTSSVPMLSTHEIIDKMELFNDIASIEKVSIDYVLQALVYMGEVDLIEVVMSCMMTAAPPVVGGGRCLVLPSNPVQFYSPLVLLANNNADRLVVFRAVQPWLRCSIRSMHEIMSSSGSTVRMDLMNMRGLIEVCLDRVLQDPTLPKDDSSLQELIFYIVPSAANVLRLVTAKHSYVSSWMQASQSALLLSPATRLALSEVMTQFAPCVAGGGSANPLVSDNAVQMVLTSLSSRSEAEKEVIKDYVRVIFSVFSLEQLKVVSKFVGTSSNYTLAAIWIQRAVHVCLWALNNLPERVATLGFYMGISVVWEFVIASSIYKLPEETIDALRVVFNLVVVSGDPLPSKALLSVQCLNDPMASPFDFPAYMPSGRAPYWAFSVMDADVNGNIDINELNTHMVILKALATPSNGVIMQLQLDQLNAVLKNMLLRNIPSQFHLVFFGMEHLFEELFAYAWSKGSSSVFDAIGFESIVECISPMWFRNRNYDADESEGPADSLKVRVDNKLLSKFMPHCIKIVACLSANYSNYSPFRTVSLFISKLEACHLPAKWLNVFKTLFAMAEPMITAQMIQTYIDACLAAVAVKLSTLPVLVHDFFDRLVHQNSSVRWNISLFTALGHAFSNEPQMTAASISAGVYLKYCFYDCKLQELASGATFVRKEVNPAVLESQIFGVQEALRSIPGKEAAAVVHDFVLMMIQKSPTVAVKHPGLLGLMETLAEKHPAFAYLRYAGYLFRGEPRISLDLAFLNQMVDCMFDFSDEIPVGSSRVLTGITSPHYKVTVCMKAMRMGAHSPEAVDFYQAFCNRVFALPDDVYNQFIVCEHLSELPAFSHVILGLFNTATRTPVQARRLLGSKVRETLFTHIQSSELLYNWPRLRNYLMALVDTGNAAEIRAVMDLIQAVIDDAVLQRFSAQRAELFGHFCDMITADFFTSFRFTKSWAEFYLSATGRASRKPTVKKLWLEKVKRSQLLS